jgi:hypothetical protein
MGDATFSNWRCRDRIMSSIFTRDDLITEINRVFPSVAKPADHDLVVHANDCVQCEWTAKHLSQFTGPILPRDALRGLKSEMSCLTTAGWRWALPSFLRNCLSDETISPIDDDETEFMIYFLGGVETSQSDATAALRPLSDAQISCIVHVLEWCGANPQWSEYCGGDIERAIRFLRYLHSE